MKILALRTDKPEAELYLFDVKVPIPNTSALREEQPEQKSHFLPGAMRNPEGVSHMPKATIKWEAHRQLAETIHEKMDKILDESSIRLNEVEGIAIFKGSGSFTGLRIGLSVANALAYGRGIPIVARGGEKWLEEGIEALLAGKNEKIVIPQYGAPAKTTSPKR